MRGVLPFILAAAILAVFVGCAGVPLLPMIQVAGSAKTGYELACMATPRERIDATPAGPRAQDNLIAERIREGLRGHRDIPVVALRPYASRGHVYLVGVFRSRKDADRALDLAKRIQGVRSVTGCLFLDNPENPYDEPGCLELERRIRARLGRELPSLSSKDLEIVVVQGHAVLFGSLRSKGELEQVEAVVRQTAGVRALDSYIGVRNTKG